MMATDVRPAWAIHLQPGSQIPPEDEAARRYLRRGNLAQTLLPGGQGPALVAGEIAISHDELRAAASRAARRLEDAGVSQGTHVALFAENSAAWIVS
jgi:acyl-CoA synthetase (AMP-forming)/AMP-acid ligase II